MRPTVSRSLVPSLPSLPRPRGAGLEVRVAFGGVWKESLTELSGGQRSLLALSLVLALCRFKPAPIYILDEVDAALDLNHTQVGGGGGMHLSGVGEGLGGARTGVGQR